MTEDIRDLLERLHGMLQLDADLTPADSPHHCYSQGMADGLRLALDGRIPDDWRSTDGCNIR